MAYLRNEDTLVEKPAINYLVNHLGYIYLDGTKLTGETGERESNRHVILVKKLEKSLKKLNPWMNNSNLNKAIYTVSHGEQLGTSLHVINEKLYNLIVNLELSLEQDIDGSGKKQYHTVKFIDFDNISNNEFHVVSQLQIKGVNETCIPDLIIYINGIPVVVIECKSPFKEKESKVRLGKKDGYEQLRRYMNLRGAEMDEGITQLFHTNFITGIFNKYHGYIGTISSKYNHYLEWKDPYTYKKSDIEDVENNGQNVFIQGILEKENLLKIMQHFILFEEEGGKKIKKVARYQQFRAVNKALDRIDSGKTPLERGGVIWATQYGFIVDYYGIMNYLEEALKVFDKSDVDGQMENLDEIYKKIQDYKEAVLRMFMGVDRSDLDAVMRVIEPENKRAEFEMAYKRYATSLEALMPNHVTKDDLNDLKWMAYVRAGAKARFEPENALDIADCGEKARAIISEHLQAKGVMQWIRPISLLNNDFQEAVDTLKSDEAIASSMEHAIKHVISVKMEDNPVHFTSLLEKLQKLLNETKLSWEERRARLKEFIDKEIELSENDETEKLGFTSNKEYAFYLKIKEVLNGEDTAENQAAEGFVSYTTNADIELYKNMTTDVVNTITENRLDGFATNKAKADEIERVIFKVLSRKYFNVGYNKLKQLVNPLLELAKRHYATDND